MQPGWSQTRTGASAAVSKIGSKERRGIILSMGSAPPRGKDGARHSAQWSGQAGQGCGRRRPRSLMARQDVVPIAELRARIGPAQNGGACFTRQTIECSAAPVILDRSEQIEQRYWFGFADDCNAAVDQSCEPCPANRCDLDDRIAPVPITSRHSDDKRSENGGPRPVRVQPSNRAPCQLIIRAAPRQDG